MRFHNSSFSFSMLDCVAEEMKTKSIFNLPLSLAFKSFSSISNISLSTRSDLVIAKNRCLFNKSGLKSLSSFSKILYCSTMSSASTAIRKSKQALRSICFKNRSPKPLPRCAPSIMPGNISHHKRQVVFVGYHT
jgi:hypothetical protein